MDASPIKTQLLADLRAERAQWDELLAEVGESRMSLPGVVAGWSVKDLVAHVTAYLRYWAAQLNGVVVGIPPTTHDLFDRDTVPPGPGTITLEEQNELIYRHYRDMPLPLVLEKWRWAFDLLTTGVAALSEDDLTTRRRFPWAGERPLHEALATSTYRHSQSHAKDVRNWLDHLGA